MPPDLDAMTFRIFYGLFQLVILAILLERGLYFVFDYRHLRARLKGKGLKAPFVLGVAWFVCWHHDFDIIARTIDPGSEILIGIFLTACIVAGGSSAAMTLFHDVLKFTRGACEKIRAQQSNPTPP